MDWKELLKFVPSLNIVDLPTLLNSSSVLRKIAFSQEGLLFAANVSGVKKKLTEVMLEEELITGEEAGEMGIIPLLQRLAGHLQEEGKI